MSTVGYRLKKLRKDKGLTLKALANGANSLSGTRMTKSAISEIEREVSRNFRPENLYAVAEFLEVYPKWLSTGIGAISQYHEIVGQRIAEARQANGWSQGQLAKKLAAWTIIPEIKVAGIQAIEFGKRLEISPALDVYAGVLQTSEQWLSGKEDDSEVDLTNLALNRGRDNIVIPKLSTTGSMEKGMPSDFEVATLISQISVNKLWIQENLSTISSPSNLAIITGHGDAMEDTFSDGDVLFVDAGVDNIKTDAVYVLDLNEHLYIKRLQRNPDDSILMISDNSKYPPYTIQNGEKDKLRVLGRIVGIWNFKRV